MISVDTKKESFPLSPLNKILPQQDEPTISFASLLKGTKESNGEILQNGSLLLALKDEKVPVASITTEVESFELDPKLTVSMMQEELKVLTKEAKQFLKEKIIQSEGFKKSEIAALPKTLSGLVQVAKKIGIDISKITLEEVKPLHVNKGTKTPKIEQKPLHVTKEAQQEVMPGDLLVVKKVKQQKTTNTQLTEKSDTTEENLELAKKETLVNKQQNKQELKQTPLFKAQSSSVEITTQQIVETKVTNLVTQKTPKQKENDTLQLLLRGEKVTKNELGLTADFSVATARVIAPQAVRETDKSLASLLKNDTSGDVDLQTKTDGLQVAKADSFEVKLNEAKQMVKYLSQDVKSAIEDYKSPFTRIRVQLHPQKMGEVDLTIVQRGKNLHVNLSSNNAAINTLAMNANDLKVQLQNNGIQNASLNFSSNMQGQDGSASQQQTQQHRQEADENYNYFDNEERHEETISSLEIIVPNYA